MQHLAFPERQNLAMCRRQPSQRGHRVGVVILEQAADSSGGPWFGPGVRKPSTALSGPRWSWYPPVPAVLASGAWSRLLAYISRINRRISRLGQPNKALTRRYIVPPARLERAT